jgi:hypothetical protein
MKDKSRLGAKADLIIDVVQTTLWAFREQIKQQIKNIHLSGLSLSGST